MKVAPVLEARVLVAPMLQATNTIVASTGATSTVALVLTLVLLAPVLLTTNTNVASTSATSNKCNYVRRCVNRGHFARIHFVKYTLDSPHPIFMPNCTILRIFFTVFAPSWIWVKWKYSLKKIAKSLHKLPWVGIGSQKVAESSQKLPKAAVSCPKLP